MSEELAALDREWAELAVGEPVVWWNPSSVAVDCFAWRDGPWEWLEQAIAEGGPYDLLGLYTLTVDSGEHIAWLGLDANDRKEAVDGATIFEAITRCAIEARKKVAQQ